MAWSRQYEGRPPLRHLADAGGFEPQRRHNPGQIGLDGVVPLMLQDSLMPSFH
jgi:hypothetical protein